MTAANEQINDLLGPEPTAEEPQVVEQTEIVTEQVSEQPQESPEEVIRKLQEERDNYKNMGHAERMERKQAQQQMQLMQQRFEQLMAAAQQPPQPEPAYDEDPLRATFSKVDKVAKTVEQLQTESMQRQQVEQFQGYVNTVKQDEQSFMAKNPDYKDAVTFLQMRRVNELKAMGYPEEQAMQVLAKDAMALTTRAQQLGESPAAFAYKMARSLGYTQKQASNIEQIAAGQQVAKSVSGGGIPINEGGIPPNLKDMSDEEFDALFKKMTGAKR